MSAIAPLPMVALAISLTFSNLSLTTETSKPLKKMNVLFFFHAQAHHCMAGIARCNKPYFLNLFQSNLLLFPHL